MITLLLAFIGVLLLAFGCPVGAFWAFAGALYKALVVLVKTMTDPGRRDPSYWYARWREVGFEDATFPEPRKLSIACLLIDSIKAVLLFAAVWDVGRIAGYF
jgi:hypothetical protein